MGKARKKSRRRFKDPNKPKGRVSAFMYFSKDARERARAINPSATFGELGKIVGAQWRLLSDAEKEPYQQMAAMDKARHEREMATYVPPPKPKKRKKDKKGGKGRGRKKKKRKGPKKPMSAFMYYSKDVRPIVKEQNPNFTFGEIGKTIGAKWRAIQPELKVKYESLAQIDKDRYNREKQTWVYEDDSSSDEEPRRKKKKRKGPKKSLSAFMFYSRAIRPSVKAQHPNMTFGELGREIGQRWRELSDLQKKPYLIMAEKDKQRYIIEKRNFVYEDSSDDESDEESEDDDDESDDDESDDEESD